MVLVLVLVWVLVLRLGLLMLNAGAEAGAGAGTTGGGGAHIWANRSAPGSQGRRAAELNAAARMRMLRCAIFSKHAFQQPKDWACVKQHILLPLQFLQSSDDGETKMVNVVDWSELTKPRHPVLMPCRATCPGCLTAGSFEPGIIGVDDFLAVELKSMNGSAKVHLCKWKCSTCGSDLQGAGSDISGIVNGTAWSVIAHSVMPTTTLKPKVVYDLDLLDLLNCVEAAHQSQNAASVGAALELYYNNFTRHLGRPNQSKTTCLRGLRAAMEMWKATKHGVSMTCNQNPFHCPGCTNGCPNVNSDANETGAALQTCQ